MANVYSTALFWGAINTSARTLYTAPPAIVTVVRRIIVNATSSAATFAHVSLNQGGFASDLYRLPLPNLLAGPGQDIDTRFVMNAGDVLTAQMAAGAGNILVMGYQLTAP